MEVRGERRGFMEAMRAFFTTIRNRIRQRRTWQRTKNYRICRNLAMVKIESAKERTLKKQVKSWFMAKINKRRHSTNITAEVDSTKSRIQEKDEAPRDLRERMRSALQAFREGRKPRWEPLNMEDTRAGEDLHETQAGEDLHIQAREYRPDTQDREELHETQAGVDLHDTQAGENLQTQAGEDVHETQTGEDLHESASWVVTYGQMWQVMAQQGDSVNCGEDLHATQAMEDIQPAEPASWVMNYGQMWHGMAQQDGPVLYGEDLQATQAGDDLQAAEPARLAMTYGQMWQELAQ
ncbi:hypothetical protein AALO_G00170920 [Alosa alosa]|uniref:Uncharacterized protein n=1 Tax=Alosa alosa TaxID=278164 RepID=A0AAV6GH79_9TELE|nr:hypothetical protein AALO_G00170920 [Alosa alosa]